MRVALVNNLYVDQLGYFYIAASLKQAGHDVRMFLTSRSLESELREYDPQMVGMTAVTGNHLWAANTAWEIKQFLPQVKTILGGPHATYHPQILRHKGLDYVCRGEGEIPVVQLAAAMEGKGDTHHIPGIWAKEGREIFENGFATLIDDLDSIPFPDRTIYEQLVMAKKNMYPFMMSSRGCPYQCTFCYAPTLAGLTKGKGKFVRFRTVDNVIQEGAMLKRDYDVRAVDFMDDIFGMHKHWLREFAEKWPREVGIPYHCNIRADLVNEETVELLASSGCHVLAFGLESGTERIRNGVLQKEVTNETIVKAAQMIKKNGMRLVTYNILGAPTETYEETWETVKLNQQIQPDYAWASIMQPYPGTGVHDFAIKEGAIADDDPDNFDPFFYQSSVITLPRRREVVNLHKLFFLTVKFPWLSPIVKQVVKIPENPLFYLTFLAMHVWGYFIRVRQVPNIFMLHLVLNIQEIIRRQKSGLYKRRLYERPGAPKPAIAPTMKERLETGAAI